jgi:hypothetical protein
MQNYFDFYVIMAHSESKRAIKKVPNVTEECITKVVDYKGRWPKPSYKARLAFVDVKGQDVAAKQQVDAVMQTLPQIPGVMYHVKYHARD